MSKRFLLTLVNEKIVSGWDDPRMSTISGIRRRGYTPSALRRFCQEIGVSKSNSMVDIEFLQYIIREELNLEARRAMAVLDPLKVVIENYPEGQTEMLEAENNPEKPEDGNTADSFLQGSYIERDDFMENPPKKFFPSFSWDGSAAEACLPCHMHRSCQERGWRDCRTSLHL